MIIDFCDQLKLAQIIKSLTVCLRNPKIISTDSNEWKKVSLYSRMKYDQQSLEYGINEEKSHEDWEYQ